MAFIAYSGLLGVITVLQTVTRTRPGGTPYAPTLPGAFIAVACASTGAWMNSISASTLEAFAFAFAGTALVTFTYGFLDFAGVPRINWWFVWPVMATLWIIGGFLARKRWL